jgi:hypothetical protein
MQKSLLCGTMSRYFDKFALEGVDNMFLVSFKFATDVTAIKVNIGKDVTIGIANIGGAPRNKSNGANGITNSRWERYIMKKHKAKKLLTLSLYRNNKSDLIQNDTSK